MENPIFPRIHRPPFRALNKNTQGKTHEKGHGRKDPCVFHFIFDPLIYIYIFICVLYIYIYREAEKRFFLGSQVSGTSPPFCPQFFFTSRIPETPREACHCHTADAVLRFVPMEVSRWTAARCFVTMASCSRAHSLAVFSGALNQRASSPIHIIRRHLSKL